VVVKVLERGGRVRMGDGRTGENCTMRLMKRMMTTLCLGTADDSRCFIACGL